MLGCSELLSHSEHCEEAYGALLALREADSGAGKEAFVGDLEAAEKEAQRLLVQETAAMDGVTLQDPCPRCPWEPPGTGWASEWGSGCRMGLPELALYCGLAWLLRLALGLPELAVFYSAKLTWWLQPLGVG